MSLFVPVRSSRDDGCKHQCQADVGYFKKMANWNVEWRFLNCSVKLVSNGSEAFPCLCKYSQPPSSCGSCGSSLLLPPLQLCYSKSEPPLPSHSLRFQTRVQFGRIANHYHLPGEIRLHPCVQTKASCTATVCTHAFSCRCREVDVAEGSMLREDVSTVPVLHFPHSEGKFVSP